MSAVPSLKRIHHVAYRCRDAKETVEWYARVLGMTYTTAFAEDHVPSTGAYDPYMHVFLDCGGNGNVLAFFELPNQPAMGSDPSTPRHGSSTWHSRFQALKALLSGQGTISKAQGIDVLGPTWHGIFQLDLFLRSQRPPASNSPADIGTPEQYAELRAVAPAMLAEWTVTKRAPRHAAWLHEDPAERGDA
jgi:glyoxylase I family protein